MELLHHFDPYIAIFFKFELSDLDDLIVIQYQKLLV